MTRNKINTKGLTSFFMTLGFFLLLITGIILYIVPAGRVANWVNWTLFGLTKTQWGNIHILSGFMLFIAGGFHIYFNWKPLKHYLYSKVRQQVNLKKEMWLSVIATAVLVIAAIAELPPFSYVFDFGEFAKESWTIEEQYEAPLGHAELLSLKSFTDKLKIDHAVALKELEAKGIKIKSDRDSLEKIAKANQISPFQIYQLIKQFEPPKEEITGEQLTAEKIEELLEGKGLGRKNIQWLITEFELQSETINKRLRENNIQATFDETFHTIADRYEAGPMDIVKVILLEGHSL